MAHYRATLYGATRPMTSIEPRTVGHYRLGKLIGRGGTSEVYTAEHVVLGDVVAIKLLRPELANDHLQTAALVEEGTKVRAIDHPNVVRVLDAGIDPVTKGCYLVMERVAGETLAERLRREGRLPEAEVRRLGAQLADGIAAAHARGIVHRDLKPANVMLDGARPKIVDFGIAKLLGARSAITTGRAVGTLAYMAPEQLASGLIAPCTDVWALGIILFEAATARFPFEDFADGRCAQLFDEPLRASSFAPVSPALDALIARCLARDPGRRPGSATELARALRGELDLGAGVDERITADHGGTQQPPLRTLQAPVVELPTVLDRSLARRRGLAPLLGLVGLAAIAGVAALVLGASNASSRSPETPANPIAAPTATPPPAPEVTPPPAVEISSSVPAPTPEPREPAVSSDLVEIRSSPAGAQVFVDRKLRGITPLRLALALPSTIELRRRGYRHVTTRLEQAGIADIELVRASKPTRATRPPRATRSTVRDTKPPMPRETLD